MYIYTFFSKYTNTYIKNIYKCEEKELGFRRLHVFAFGFSTPHPAGRRILYYPNAPSGVHAAAPGL